MPTVQQIIAAYDAAPGGLPQAPAPGGQNQDSTLAFLPPLVGLIRPGSGTDAQGQPVTIIEFTFYPACLAWIPLPSAIIDRIDLLGKRACRGATYDLAKITFNLPTDPIQQFFAGLLLQSTSTGPCSCSDTSTKTFSQCATVTIRDGKACVNLPSGLGKKCVSVPDWVPNGTVAEICFDLCKKFGVPCGAEVYVNVAGERVASESFGCCDD